MPVRPLTQAEYKLANGEPVSSWLMVLGASQGFLTHLRLNGLTFNAKNLVPTPFAKATLPALMIGGGLAGFALGYVAYGDTAFERLALSHTLDRASRSDSAKFVPVEKL